MLFASLFAALNFQRLNVDIVNASEEGLSFAAFADTHIGARVEYSGWQMADHLDDLAQDIMNNISPTIDFAVHLGDIINHRVSNVEGVGLPGGYDPYKDVFKAFLVQHLNLPFHLVPGNHDLDDYYENSDDPHNLIRALVNTSELNSYPYAMMRDNILFLAIPEDAYVMWTSPRVYEWVQYMTKMYSDTTTIILSHQAIEDTTNADETAGGYRGKQDTTWWASLFRNNTQIKMWIHGHQHWADWYQGNETSGLSYPICDFGHEMVFSSPYSQSDWANRHEEDRIVVYAITPTSISTRAWENNGGGGGWVSGYDHTWNVPTTYNESAEDWYSFPIFIQDGETQLTDMKVLSSKVTLQLIGSIPMELFYDPRMESKDGWANENILGFGDDSDSEVTPTLPGVTLHGPADLTFPPKYGKSGHEDGRSGQPYNFFPIGVSPAAVPGATYNFTMTAKSDSGSGTATLDVSVSDWSTRSQYSTLPGSPSQVFSHSFGSSYETISGTYTVPNDRNAWFLQGTLDFSDSTDYDVSYFSITRARTTDTADDFHMCVSGKWYNVSGTLGEDEYVEFSVNPEDLANHDGVINFTASIGGNHYGIARLIFSGPLLMSRNARFRVNNLAGNTYNITLTKTVSGYSSTFKVFPFNMKYGGLTISADDGSGVEHESSNGREWGTCNCPNSERNVIINYPTSTRARALRMDPTTITCHKYCESFEVQISITDAIKVEDFEFEIQYNSTLLDYVDVTWDAWGTGIIDSSTDGILTGYTSGIPINGTTTVITITLHAAYYYIWKDCPDWTNDLVGTIYFQWANLSYPDAPDLRYVKGVLYEIDVVPIEVSYTFSPLQGDVDNDGDVDILDLRTVAAYYNVEEGDALWSAASAYDLNGDLIVDIFDLVIIAVKFGTTYP